MILTFDFFPCLHLLSIFEQICRFIIIIPSFLPLSGASTDNLPPGVLYKVKASYKYQAEDVDELNFEVGEIMHVVPYEDPEEQVKVISRNLAGNPRFNLCFPTTLQEEGWLMGIKEANGQKGMFPANFTRPM